MKVPSIGTLSFGAVGLAALVLIAIGPPGSHVPAPPPAPSGPTPSSVSFGGFTLVSNSVDLPMDEQQYPDGPHADVINANCTSCHSASMALTQPALSAEQWKATVTKMKEVYKAPVADKDIPVIIDYLTALSAKQDGTAPAVTGAGAQSSPDAFGGTG